MQDGEFEDSRMVVLAGVSRCVSVLKMAINDCLLGREQLSTSQASWKIKLGQGT